MFWSGNYITVRTLNVLLKEQNFTLAQVLEADDIIQECKADNKALIQFLTKPEILAELITLITEEPPKNVELAQQYRHASIACEVLTSQLPMLNDRLSLDTVQMNRLCDFINRDPPLNPLLASYFSKTVEMLLERSTKQDCYLYHIVCLRVLDFFKSRRDFLPNLLRHIATSAIADIFKYFIRLDDLFHKIVMEWFEEHQLLESLIQIICGTYVPEELSPEPIENEPQQSDPHIDQENNVTEPNHNEEHHEGNKDSDNEESDTDENGEGSGEGGSIGGGSSKGAGRGPRRRSGGRIGGAGDRAGVASANAAALLCDLILNGCAVEGCSSWSSTALWLCGRVGGAAGVRGVLQAAFTSPAPRRDSALVHAALLLRALLHRDPILPDAESERTSVELAIAPHLPLLHQALLQPPPDDVRLKGRDWGQAGGQQGARGAGRVGHARVQVAALLAHLALSEVDDVATTLLTLGTPGVMLDMFFEYPDNNFLHAEVYTMIKNALSNQAHRPQYARHLFEECNLVTRLMDAFEENENREVPRRGYMGHVVLCLSRVARVAPETLQAARGAGGAAGTAGGPRWAERWARFHRDKLQPLLDVHETPLGGYYPSEHSFEVENMVDPADNYDYADMATSAAMDDRADDALEISTASAHAAASGTLAEDRGDESGDEMSAARSSFLQLAGRRFDDDMWDDAPDGDAELEAPPGRAIDVLRDCSPWESTGGTGGGAAGTVGGAGEGWAQFDAPSASSDLSAFWAYGDATAPAPAPATASVAAPAEEPATKLETGIRDLKLEADKSLDEASTAELANNLLTAMSGMTPDAIANIVNANLDPAFNLPDPPTS